MGKIIKKIRKELICTVCLLYSFQIWALPTWVNTPRKNFPASKYMVAVGSGSSEKKADLAAIEELAAQFGRDVKSTNKSSSQMKQIQRENITSTEIAEGLSTEIIQKVSVENLMGVEIREHCEEKGKYYALAILDIEKATMLFIESIKSNDERCKNQLNIVEEASFETIKNLSYAKNLAMVNEKYLEKLKVINQIKYSELIKEVCTPEIINRKKSEIVDLIPVYINIDGDYDNQISQGLAQMLTNAGLKTSKLKNERYSITGEVVLTRRDTSDGKTVQCIYSFEGKLEDNYMEECILPISISGRESSSDYENAKIRAIKSIVSKIKTTTNVSFLNFINSQ